ncbi:hypothetical protein BC826DRAFT_1108181, partial [Russula brevipes]
AYSLVDVLSIEKSDEYFRLLYDAKGRFVIHRITAEEAGYKLLKVNDTVRFDLTQNKISGIVKFDTGNLVMITGGRNMGRMGSIVHREKHIGDFDIVHVKDALDRTFATRITNIFVIGEGTKPWISVPKGKGIKLTIAEERDVRRKRATESQ